jgi:hypothetical protein
MIKITNRIRVHLNFYNKLHFILLILAVTLRFFFQFIYPTFDKDEIALGENIFHKSFTELLFPLDNFQSSPPFYLLIQKLFVNLPIAGWVSIKLLGFIVSVSSCILALRVSKRLFKKEPLQLIFTSLIFFNPFIVYNSITVKQYGCDLLFALLMMLSYNKILNKNYLLFFFFLTWTLVSNIGLFFAAGYLIHLMIHGYVNHGIDLRKILKENFNKILAIVISLIPYIIYFVWFMNQSGANELKSYMQDYWKHSFVPLNTEIFYFSIQFIHGMGIFFISSYRVLGYLGIFLSIIGLCHYFLKFRARQYPVINTFMYAVITHGFISTIHFYPLSDRLYLYMAPLVFFLALNIFEYLKNRYITFVPIVLFGCIIILYSTYIPYRENDVAATYRYIKDQNVKTVICSVKSYSAIERFNEFTSNHFANDLILTNLDERKLNSYSNKLYISRVHHKFGHSERTAREEESTLSLIKLNKISLIKKIDGYNIYVFR